MAAANAGTSQRRTSAQQMWGGGGLADLQYQLEADVALINYKSKKSPAIRLAFFPSDSAEHSKASPRRVFPREPAAGAPAAEATAQAAALAH